MSDFEYNYSDKQLDLILTLWAIYSPLILMGNRFWIKKSIPAVGMPFQKTEPDL